MSSVKASMDGNTLLMHSPKMQVPMKRNTPLVKKINNRHCTSMTPTWKKQTER